MQDFKASRYSAMLQLPLLLFDLELQVSYLSKLQQELGSGDATIVAPLTHM